MEVKEKVDVIVARLQDKLKTIQNTLNVLQKDIEDLSQLGTPIKKKKANTDEVDAAEEIKRALEKALGIDDEDLKEQKKNRDKIIKAARKRGTHVIEVPQM
jgi:hypothetical protein